MDFFLHKNQISEKQKANKFFDFAQGNDDLKNENINLFDKIFNINKT